MILNRRFIPCISGGIAKVKKMDMREDQRMGIIMDIAMENGMDMRRDMKMGSIEECGLERHGRSSHHLY